MDELKTNSDRSRANPTDKDKKVEKVISGEAKIKKKNEVQKLGDVFVSEDIGSVKNYIWVEVLVPAIKKAISDVVTNGIDMILYGEDGRDRRPNNRTKNSYQKYYQDQEKEKTYQRSKNTNYYYDDILFASRRDAENVLAAMSDIIEEFGIVSVSDLYELADIQTVNYTLNRYGWSDINRNNSSVVRVRDGYILKLPKAIAL